MPRLREKKRLREQRLTGIKTAIPTYVPPELILRGFKLKFYDTSDVKIGELGSDVKTGKVIDVSFELRTLGCGAFSFILDDESSFAIGFRTRVDIHPYFDALPWFTGFIQTIPQTGQKRPFEYTGFGFFDQLDWVTVTGSYEDDELADIVKDIIQNIVAPDTQIIYNAAKIEATGYTVNSIDFDHAFAKDAIQTLADMAQDYEFGVDDSRQFYFRPIETDVNYSYWVGKHFQNIEIEKDPFTVRNKLYIKIGEIQAGGTNIIGSVQNNDSITAYGLREEVITVPESLNSADATRWANMILSELKDPAVKAKIVNILFDETKAKIIAQGKARITMYEGTEYSLFIKTVSYSITAGGILGAMELEWETSGLEGKILTLVKDLEEEKRLSDKRAKQLYLAGGGNGGGAVPIGVIVPYLGGYFTNGENGGFTMIMAAANTVAAVNTLLNPDGFYVCDGAALNLGESPIFDGAGRYLPNLTDDRFIMGDTLGGAVGGNNAMAHTHGITVNNHTLTTSEMPSHYHTMFSSVTGNDYLDASDYPYFRRNEANEDDYMIRGGGTVSSRGRNKSTGGGSGHNHGASSGAASNTENRPKFLGCFYIMRVI